MSPRARLTYSHYDQLIHAAVAGQGVAIGRAELVTGWSAPASWCRWETAAAMSRGVASG